MLAISIYVFWCLAQWGEYFPSETQTISPTYTIEWICKFEFKWKINLSHFFSASRLSLLKLLLFSYAKMRRRKNNETNCYLHLMAFLCIYLLVETVFSSLHSIVWCNNSLFSTLSFAHVRRYVAAVFIFRMNERKKMWRGKRATLNDW